MGTTFALISDYQVRENYGDRWKSKFGGEITVATSLSIEEALDTPALEALVKAARPEDNDMFRYSNEMWWLETLDADLIERVRTHNIKGGYGNDLGYAQYCFDGAKYAYEWAMLHYGPMRPIW